jgi:deoxyribonuclease-4
MTVVKQTRPWGAHMSTSGGVASALDRGESVGATAIQLFTKNNNRWSAKPLTPEEIVLFHERTAATGVTAVASHDCYLINLASPDPVNHKKSVDAFLDEIDRAALLHIPNLVFHPGSHVGEGEEAGIERIATTLDAIIDQRPDPAVTLAIETTAGQGTNLGWRFEQIAAIIDASRHPERFGVCLDTCHVHAAGYDLITVEGYAATIAEFDALIGLEKLKLFHVNDSKRERGSRVDRHDHIGKGDLGLAAFRHLVNDPRFVKTPMILETPKGKESLEDRENLATLNKLVGS